MQGRTAQREEKKYAEQCNCKKKIKTVARANAYAPVCHVNVSYSVHNATHRIIVYRYKCVQRKWYWRRCIASA